MRIIRWTRQTHCIFTIPKPSCYLAEMDDSGSDSNDFPNIEELDSDLPQAQESQVPWPNWSEEQKGIISQHFNYLQEMLLLVNRLWTNGPSRDSVPKKPASEITQLLETGYAKRRKRMWIQSRK